MEMKMPALACAICTCCCLCCGMSFPGLVYQSVDTSQGSTTASAGLWGMYQTGDDQYQQYYSMDLPSYDTYDGCKQTAGSASWPLNVKDADLAGDKNKSFCSATRGLYVWTFLLSFFALCANAGGMMMPMLNYVAAVLHLLTGFFAMVTFAYFAAKEYDPTDSYSFSYSFVILVVFWLIAWLTAGLSAMAAMNAGSSDGAPPASEAATEEIPDGGAAVTAKV